MSDEPQVVVEPQAEPAQEPVPPVQGEPESTTPKPVEPTTSKPVEPVKDDGTVKRLEQKAAKFEKAMKLMGLDPNSEIVEQIAAGIISPEEAKAIVYGRPAPAPTPQNPVETPIETMRRIQAKADKGESISNKDFAEYSKADLTLREQQMEREQVGKIQQIEYETRSAVDNVLNTDEFHQKMPSEVKSFENQLFWGSTDCLIGTKIRDDGISVQDGYNRYANARSYDFYARQNLQDLAKYRNYLIEYGKSLVTKPKDNVPEPIGSTTGSGPIQMPKANFNNRKSISQELNEYQARSQTSI